MKIGKSYSKGFALLACLVLLALRAAASPKVGDKAPDLFLQTLENQAIRLSGLTSKGRVVLIVLRGWPGYQCPRNDEGIVELDFR